MIDDQSEPGGWREALRFRKHMYTGEADMTSTEEPYKFSIDSAVANEIALRWLPRHLDYAEEEIARGTTGQEDWIDADKDVRAIKRLIWYLAGEESK